MISIRLTRAEKIRRLLVSIFYFASAAAMLYCFLNSTSTDDKLLYSGLLLFVVFGVFYEFIRYFYSRTSYSLNEQCDTVLAGKYLKYLKSLNIFGSYKAQIAYLEGIIMLDDDRPEEAREFIISRLGNMNASNRIMDFQFNYLLFSCCVALKDKRNIGEYYNTLKRIFSMKERPGSKFLSLWNFINGVYGLVSGNDAQAAESFQKVKPEDLSMRERARYYFYSSELNARRSDKGKMDECYNKAYALAPRMKLIINRQPKI